MQVMELNKILERVESQDHIACLMKSLRADDKIWAYLTELNDENTTHIANLAADHKLNPGTVGLLAFNPGLVETDYPKTKLQVSTLEECMVTFEVFVQQKLPPQLLEDAAKLAVVLIEKRKITNGWAEVFTDIFTRQHLTSGQDFKEIWGSSLVIATHLADDADDLLNDLLKFHSSEEGIPSLAYCAISLPISVTEMADRLGAILENHKPATVEKVLAHLRSIHEYELATDTAIRIITKIQKSISVDVHDLASLQELELALQQSLNYKQLSLIAQVAGEVDLAENLLSKAIHLVSRVSDGLRVQNLSILEQAGKRFEFENAAKSEAFYHFDDPDLQCELASLGISGLGSENSHPLNKLHQAKKISLAGNLELAKMECEKSFSDPDEKAFEVLASYQPRFNPVWKGSKSIEWLLEMGANGEAVKAARNLLQKNPASIEACLIAIKALMEDERFAEAQPLLEWVTLSTVGNTPAERNLADCYKHTSNLSKSYELRKTLAANDQAEMEDLLNFADAAVLLGKPEEVFEATAKVLEIDPDNAQAMSLNGKAYSLTNDREKASEFYGKAIELGSEDAAPWIGLSDLHLTDGDARAAVATLRNGLSANPQSLDLKRRLAELLMEIGSATEALPLLNELARSSKDIQVKVLQAEAMKILGLEEYSDLVAKLFEQHPQDEEISRAHAVELLKKGKRAEAKLVLLEQAKEFKPGDPSALTYADAVVGIDFEYSGEIPELSAQDTLQVQRILDECLSLDVDNSRAQLLKAELFTRQGDHENAYKAYSKLLENQSVIDKSLFERIQAGFALSAALTGKIELALAAIKSAVESRPEWVGLRKVMARIYALAGEVSDALEQASMVLEMGNRVLDGIFWFIDFLSNLGKTEEAEAKLREVLNDYPDHLRLQAKMAELLVKNGKHEEAKQMVAKISPILTSNLSDEEQVAAIHVFDQTGDIDSAILCLEERAKSSKKLQRWLDLAGYLVEHESYEKALVILGQIDADTESDRLLTLLKADVLIQSAKGSEALELLESNSTENHDLELNNNLFFVSERWKELINSPYSGLQMKARLAFSAGKPEQSRIAARQWLDLDADNSEAWILYLESNLALGGNLEEIVKINLANEIEADLCGAYLASLKMDWLLQNEQAIDAQKCYDKYVVSGSLPVRAIGLRLSLLSGHLAEAENALDELLGLKSDIDALEDFLKIGLTRNLVKACVDMNRWQEALTLAHEAALKFDWNANSTRQYLMVLALAKEFDSAASLLLLEAHAPYVYLQGIHFEEELDWLAGLLNGKAIEDVERWSLRGKMAASPNSANIKAFALLTPKPDDVAAMVSALSQNGQETTAIQVAKKFNDSAPIMFQLARIQANKEPEVAIETLSKLLTIDPLNPMASVLRANLYEQDGKTDLAINDLEQAISDWPNEIRWRLKVAELWQKHGNLKNAIEQLQKANAIKEGDPEITLALGKVYVEDSVPQKAVDILDPFVKTNPNVFEAWETLAEAFYRNTQIDQALQAAKKASEINPYSTTPYLMSGRILLETGHANLALEQAKKAIHQNKKSAEAVLFLARVLIDQGEKRQALAALEMTNQCENISVQNMIDHVNLVREINGGAYAKDLINDLSKKHPENVELLKLLASAQADNGDTSDAEQTAKRALQVDPDEPELHLFLGKINAETGQLDQAIHHLSQGITSKRDGTDGYLLLSKVYEQQREFTKAIETLQQAMDNAPDDTRSYLAAANLYRNSKDYTAAEKVLQKAIEIDPKDVTIRRQLGALLALKLVHHSQEAGSQS